MRLTDFWERMHQQFGEAYAQSFARDVVIRELGGRTVEQALAQGEDARTSGAGSAPLWMFRRPSARRFPREVGVGNPQDGPVRPHYRE